MIDVSTLRDAHLGGLLVQVIDSAPVALMAKAAGIDFLLVDGNRFLPYGETPYACIVKGDGKYMSIAAASVLAKTHRDEYMRQLDKEYPAYHWAKNKGYPTRDHREAIAAHGISPLHRRTFQLLDRQMSLPFGD